MKDSLVGKWGWKQYGIDLSYEFFPDGKYVYNNNITGSCTRGTYSVEGGAIVYPQIGASNEYRLQGGSLELLLADNEWHKFSKIS